MKLQFYFVGVVHLKTFLRNENQKREYNDIEW